MKKVTFPLLLVFSFSLSTYVTSQTIETIAGNGATGYSGNGGPATSAEFNFPNAVGFDNAGNIYVADESNSVIRKINSSGVITTIAGNGVAGFSGNGGQATAAEIRFPEGVWADKRGNVYIADLGNYRIRKVHTTGLISTFAGNGAQGYSGDGGHATSAELWSPYRVAIDTADNIYIADQGENRIRKVDTAGVITTVAGNGISGYSGDAGQATSAELKNPYGLSVDMAGNIFIADCGNNRIRQVTTNGIITTIAGNGTAGFSGDGNQATTAELYGPFGVAADAFGNIFIDDQINNRIREVTSSGIISTLAGNGFAGFSGDGGPATAAEFYSPWDVSVDALGNVFIADEQNQRVREVPTLSTNIEQLSVINSQWTVYPNPNNGKFTVQSQGVSCQWSVEVFNVLGKEVFAHHESSNGRTSNYQIDLSSKPSGIYLYRITNADGSLLGSGKIIIE